MKSVRLSPEVIVDLSTKEAYVTNPEGGIAAVELRDGKQLWQSDAAAKPLAVTRDRLLGQAESTQAENKLGIVTLDREHGGRSINERSVDLPAGVVSAPRKGLQQVFRTAADVLDGEAEISWEYQEQRQRGMPSDERRTQPGDKARLAQAEPETDEEESANASGVVVKRGAFRLDLDSGKVTARPTPATPIDSPPVDVSQFEHLPDVPEPQFLSADAKHVLSSSRIADDSVVEKYSWKIYDREAKTLVGETKSQVSFTPFVVSDSKLIFVSQPNSVRTEAGMVKQPLQMKAVDLTSGSEAWHREVRDTSDREPPPP